MRHQTLPDFPSNFTSHAIPNKSYALLVSNLVCLTGEILSGALQLTLEDVYHSPVGSVDGTETKKGRLWYGSGPVLEQWIKYITEDGDYSARGTVPLTEIIQPSVPATSV